MTASQFEQPHSQQHYLSWTLWSMFWDLPSRCSRTPFIRAQALGVAVADLSRGDSGSSLSLGAAGLLQ
jgi:hypothetical protein